MKSIYKYLDTRLFLIGLLVLPFLAVVSCQNDDDDAIPVIHYIRVTEDLKFADVYFSIMSGQMNGEKAVDKETVLEGLNQIKGYLRKRVAEEIEIRYIPEIRVKLDDSIEHAIKISKLLNDLKG